jgi:phosphatidylserine decarboxylase
MHYPDDGTTLDHQRLGRRLWTVNWHALQSKPDILFANERNVNILETRHFGRLGFVDRRLIGWADSAGPSLHVPFRRGEEKAVFRFGGSAIVVFGERGKWSPSADLLEHTRENVETLVPLGDCVATAGAQR